MNEEPALMRYMEHTGFISDYVFCSFRAKRYFLFMNFVKMLAVVEFVK
jgi:hypothetical protein